MIKIVEHNSESSRKLIRKLELRSQFESEPILITVREILADVRKTGDNAVIKYTRKFDAPDMPLQHLQVSDQEIDLAYSKVEDNFLDAIRLAKSNIEKFHRKQLRNSWITTETNGTILGHLIRPLHRVGVCVPSVSQLLVSSLIMNVVPAKVAGVEEIAVFMGPKADGTIDRHMLTTAAECGTREIYKCGGAQAIAAMAYGTNTIAKVDKAVGPGNLYVQIAKKEVHGLIDIDKIAGPSEVLVIADEHANPSHIAADLISQAEHGEDSSAILVTTSKEIAQKVESQITSQIANLPRQKEITGAFENYGVAFVVEDLDQAINLANHIAPEHLELDVAEPWQWLGKIRNAGAIMIGKFTPESVGDYIAGPNHILPTGGTAKYASPLSVDDFIKKTSLIHYTKTALKEVTPAVTKLADVEGLKGHAAAMEMRFDTD